MKRCKKCGKISQDSDIFCGECGTNLEKNFTYICNRCGRLFDKGDSECPNCHIKPDIQLSNTATVSAKEIQDVASQKADELKEKTAVAATVVSGAASSFIKTASEKATEAGQKATELAKTASEKTSETKDKVVTAVRNSADNISKDKTLPTNNKLILSLIVAALLIGGMGSYILFGRTSDDKKTVAQSQPVQTPQPTNPADSVSTPKPVETPSPVAPPVQQFRVDQSNPRSAFISFHSAITNRQLAEAYNILSPNYQRFMRSYDNFARGYNTTLRSDIVDLNELYRTPNFATYSYKLKAVDREGSGTKTQYFAGKATLVLINGLWRLDSTEAKRL